MSSKQIGAESHFGRLFNDGTYGDAQWWIKQRDYESLRRRFEKACARITELESATETPAARPRFETCAEHGIYMVVEPMCPVCGAAPGPAQKTT